MKAREIEDVLLEHGAVREVFVVAPASASKRNGLWAFVVLGSTSAAAIYGFNAYCESLFADAGSDVGVTLIRELPRTPTGSVDRRRLSALCGMRDGQGDGMHLRQGTTGRDGQTDLNACVTRLVKELAAPPLTA